jgi:hypothetical protein
MALLCRVRALNVRTRVREQARVSGASSEAEVNPRARRNLLEGGVSPRARRNPLEGAVNPRARRNLLEVAVNPRARRNLLEEAFGRATRWAAGATAAWAVPCVCA